MRRIMHLGPDDICCRYERSGKTFCSTHAIGVEIYIYNIYIYRWMKNLAFLILPLPVFLSLFLCLFTFLIISNQDCARHHPLFTVGFRFEEAFYSKDAAGGGKLTVVRSFSVVILLFSPHPSHALPLLSFSALLAPHCSIYGCLYVRFAFYDRPSPLPPRSSCTLSIHSTESD